MPLTSGTLSAAREVRTMLQGVSLAQFQAALIVMRATERCIEIIGERRAACRKQPNNYNPRSRAPTSSKSANLRLTRVVTPASGFDKGVT
jgi:hypothetical protein